MKIYQGSFKSYVLGFILSAILTLAAYGAAVWRIECGLPIELTLGALGLLQVWVLLYLFLDLNKEPRPRWNLLVFLFMIMVTAILVVGSIWIMYHLNYNLMIMK